MALLSAGAFMCGWVRLGGLFFLARFFFDVLDGMVARIQGTSSYRGGVLDQVVDVTGIHLIACALAWRATLNGASVALALGLIFTLTLFSWMLMLRKKVALESMTPYGGGQGGLSARVNAWTSWTRARNLMPIPYSVEAETVVFGLVPALGGSSALPASLYLGSAFYLTATFINTHRVFRLADRMDSEKG
jgi:phosphatidylglycerophosphate synthase